MTGVPGPAAAAGRVGAAAVLTPRAHLVVEHFDDALLIWDDEAGLLHHLDLPAAIVWEELDGRPLGEVCRGLAAEFGSDGGRVHEDVLALAGRLVADGLVTVRQRGTA